MLDGDRRDVQVVATSSAEGDGPAVGELLRAARRAAGMTLEQVSAVTRIRVPVLRRLEDDDLGPAGSAVYTRGHLRAIAAAVGTDPAPLVRALDERLGVAAPSAVVLPETVPAPRQPTPTAAALSARLPARLTTRLPARPAPVPPERSEPRWLTASLLGLAVLVALLTIDTFSGGGEDREPEAALTTPQAAATAVPPQTATPDPVSEARLVLEATGRSWLSVRNRGSVRLFEGEVEAGWTRRFDDPVVVTVRVGDAAAVRASCGGVAAPAPGGAGVPVTLRCTPQGMQRP